MPPKYLKCPLCGHSLTCINAKRVTTGYTESIKGKKYCELCDKVFKIKINKEVEC